MNMFARTVKYYLYDPCSTGGERQVADEPRDHLPAAAHRLSQGSFILTLFRVVNTTFSAFSGTSLRAAAEHQQLSGQGFLCGIRHGPRRSCHGLHLRLHHSVRHRLYGRGALHLTVREVSD